MRLKEIAICFLISVAVAFSILLVLGDSKKEGYIDMIKLNDQFELKIDLQNDLDQELKKGHQIIDNLKLEIQRVYNDSLTLGNDRFITIKQLQTDIEAKTYEYAQKEQELTEKYNAQILTQLNEYLKQFGEENNIDILFGASGQGTLLYGKEKYDLTEQCIAFVNGKYKGE